MHSHAPTHSRAALALACSPLTLRAPSLPPPPTLPRLPQGENKADGKPPSRFMSVLRSFKPTNITEWFGMMDPLVIVSMFLFSVASGERWLGRRRSGFTAHLEATKPIGGNGACCLPVG